MDTDMKMTSFTPEEFFCFLFFFVGGGGGRLVSTDTYTGVKFFCITRLEMRSVKRNNFQIPRYLAIES